MCLRQVASTVLSDPILMKLSMTSQSSLLPGMQCGEAWCNVLWCGIIWCDVAWSRTILLVDGEWEYVACR